MADMGASVLARLKNKAAETGRSNQLCLQLFCQEEFLRRVEKSRYAENLVLKGGLFLYTLTNFDSRVTMDVDFLLRQMPNTPEQLRSVLEEIITTDVGNDPNSHCEKIRRYRCLPHWKDQEHAHRFQHRFWRWRCDRAASGEAYTSGTAQWI